MSYYPEEDNVLKSRAHLAISKTYTVSELGRLANRVNIFDTLDGYRLTIAKVQDVDVLCTDRLMLYIVLQPQKGKTIVKPKTTEGCFALACEMLLRLGLKQRVYKFFGHQTVGDSLSVWGGLT